MNQGIADNPAWQTIQVWGLSLAVMTSEDVLAEIDRLIALGEPSYMITANLNYAMLSEQHPDLATINREAACVLADGMPLLWAARWRGQPLPERVAGSDLIFRVSERASTQGYRLYFLGGPPGVGEAAAANLGMRYPGLVVVGVEAPPYRELTAAEDEALRDRIRAARPDILIAAFGQPKGERWVHANYRTIGIPLCLQLGASIDFAAGRVSRAPRWMQRGGLEWLYRLWLEPRRLGGRYCRNSLFLARKMILGDHPQS